MFIAFHVVTVVTVVAALADPIVTVAVDVGTDAGTRISECRAQRDAFDVDATIAACGAVADDANVDVASRIFALRLLAGAHLLKKDEHASEMILVRMLAFDADAAPAPDDGPEFRLLLERARARVLDAGALEVRIVRAEGRATAVRVADRHGRVARAELVDDTAALRVALARIDEAPGVSSFALPADVGADAHVVLSGWTNKVLRDERVAPSLDVTQMDVAQLPRHELDALGFVLVGSGAALAVTGAAFWGATTYDLNYREPCQADPAGCVPDKKLLFGIYSRENRAQLFVDQSGWLLASTAAMGAGTLLAVAGVGLITYE